MRPLAREDAVPITTRTGDAWQVATELVHAPFAVGAPLYRAVIADDGHAIVLGLDHIAFDGRSAALFASEIARTLDGVALEPLPFDDAPLDARLDLRPSVRQVLAALRSKPFPAPLLAVEGTMRTGMRHFAIEDAASVRSRARDRSVSLHAMISVAALDATAQVLGQTRLRLHTPVSLRDRCVPEPLGLGVFIAGIDGDFDAPFDARAIRDHLARERPRAPGNVGMLALAGDLRERARRLDAHASGRTASVEVSNVGRIEGATRLWLTQGAHYHGAPFVLTIVETDAVRASLSFPEPLVSAARADAFVAAFHTALTRG